MDPDGVLQDLIPTVMMHNPCGVHNEDAPCMEKDPKTGHKWCSKHFPKDYSDITCVGDDGYPVYCHHYNPSVSFTKWVCGQDVMVDNWWVVPYIPYLMWHYRAHINTEICASINVIKYLNKYIYKGPDRMTLTIANANNEVDLHLHGHYIGPTEVVWHLLEFHSHQEFPPVEQLQVHLLDQQVVAFDEGMMDEDLHH